jgi:hypothetical protein
MEVFYGFQNNLMVIKESMDKFDRFLFNSKVCIIHSKRIHYNFIFFIKKFLVGFATF